MRGQQTLLSLFPSAIEPKPERKGHRGVHTDRRDDAIAYRFFYLQHLKRWQYEDILVQLEKEFYITPDVIVQRLLVRTDVIKDLLKRDAKVVYLRKQYPWFAWN